MNKNVSSKIKFIQFGFFFSFLSLILVVYPTFFGNEIKFFFLFFFFIFFLSSILYPKLIKPIYLFWMKLSFYLGKVTNPVILAILFFTFFLTIGIFLKIFKKKPLKMNFNKKLISYWSEVEDKNINFKDQF